MIALLLAATIFMQRPGALQPGTGIVTGTLKVEGGASAAGIRVGAVAVDDPTASSFLSVAETDAAGRFRLTNVPAGRYYIVAGRLNNLQYFPNGNSPSQATEVAVEPARTRTDVNFTVASGSSRPPQPAPRPSFGLNSLSASEFSAYRDISVETNIDRKVALLLAFEKNYPKSTALPHVYTSLMNIYVTKGNSRSAMDYGEKVIRLDANNVSALVQVSRTYTILQTNPAKAIEYAQKAATLAARDKTMYPQDKWIASMDASAQANFTWVKRTADWQQKQFLSFIAPRRAR
jgi:tetratricopeptide (TPR) repeat protein